MKGPSKTLKISCFLTNYLDFRKYLYYLYFENILIIKFELYRMPRKKRLRKVVAPPGFKGYRPYGTHRDLRDTVELFYEEYEALKLTDYDLMNHKEASAVMGISRPTFARIYEKARRKIALALVETREIIAIYGNAWMDKNWFMCNNCQARFTIPTSMNDNNCPVCSSIKIESLQLNQVRSAGE